MASFKLIGEDARLRASCIVGAVAGEVRTQWSAVGVVGAASSCCHFKLQGYVDRVLALSGLEGAREVVCR